MITCRRYADVLPELVAEAQTYWELLRLGTRLRAAGVPFEEAHRRLGTMPGSFYNSTIDPTSPLEKYLAGGTGFETEVRRLVGEYRFVAAAERELTEKKNRAGWDAFPRKLTPQERRRRRKQWRLDNGSTR